MADVNNRYIILNDLWPGLPNPTKGIPTGGWDNTTTSGNCVSAPTFPIGEKRIAYSDGTINPGMYTMAYLRWIEGSDCAFDTGAFSEGNLCARNKGLACVDSAADASEYQWWNVTSDCTNSDATVGGGALAVACRAFSTGEYGWFWVGGVCPYADITAFDTLTAGAGADIATGGGVVAGKGIVMCDDGTNSITIDGVGDGTYEVRVCGWALKTDA